MAPLITKSDRHGADGDHQWCEWRCGAPLVPLRPSPLEPMDRHWHHFLSPMAPMVRTPNRYDPFTERANSEEPR